MCCVSYCTLSSLTVLKFSADADVVRSAIGFSVFTALLSAWALTFSIGGEQLFGPVYDKLVMYNVADRLGLSGLA